MSSKPFSESTSRAPISQRGQHRDEFDKNTLGNQVKVVIDDVEIKVPMGCTLLEAAQMINIKIPTLCQHDDLDLAGVCRMCIVEVEGQRTLQSACSYPIFAPLKVKTYSPKVRRARKNILQLLLRRHYGECYSCSRNNNCELQALAKEYGVGTYKFGHIAAPRYEKD